MWPFTKQLEKNVPEEPKLRAIRTFKNFKMSSDNNSYLMTHEQYLAFLLALDAAKQSSRGGFTWDEVALGVLDALMEHGYLDKLKEEKSNDSTPEE